MSYSCYISFKKMPKEDMFDFFGDLKQACSERIADIAKDNASFCPYIRRSLNIPEQFLDVPVADRQAAEFWARACVFSYKYSYDSSRGMLYMFGIPTAARDMFDGTVFFQNSCDQDYNREDWKGIPEFEAIYDKWMAKSDAEILQDYFRKEGMSLYDVYNIDAGNPAHEQKLRDKIDYYKRTGCYDEIFSHYSDALYNDERYTSVALYGGYDALTIGRFVRKCHTSYLEEMKQWEEEWKAKHPEEAEASQEEIADDDDR